MRSAKVLSFLVSISFVGCAAPKQLHVRGELDQINWTVHACDSDGETYRVILASTQVPWFDRKLAEAGVSGGEPIVVDFEGPLFPRCLPWGKDTVGIESNVRIEHGTCGQSCPSRECE